MDEVSSPLEDADRDQKLLADRLDAVIEGLGKIEATLSVLVQQRTAKDWYGTGEVAEKLGKARFTVRECCRQGRIQANKRRCGRGQSQEWVISHAELVRIQ